MNSRESIIQSAGALIRAKGYFGTGVNEITKESKVPKGSLYHHFPGGKDEIIESALEEAAMQLAISFKNAMKGKGDAAKGLAAVVDIFIDDLKENNLKYGCPLAAVSMDVAMENEHLRSACSRLFKFWIDAIEGYLNYKNVRSSKDKAERFFDQGRRGHFTFKSTTIRSPSSTGKKRFKAIDKRIIMEKFPSSVMQIRFQDCDPMSILNNSRYIDYFMNAREDHLATFYGLNIYDRLKENGTSWVVAKNEIIYRKPAFLMEKVLIKTQVNNYSLKHIEVEMVMFDESGQKLKALMRTVFVPINVVKNESIEHEDSIMQLLGKVRVDDVTENIEERVMELQGALSTS